MKRTPWSVLAVTVMVGLAACGGAGEDDAGMHADTVMPAPAPGPAPMAPDTTGMRMDAATDTMM